MRNINFTYLGHDIGPAPGSAQDPNGSRTGANHVPGYEDGMESWRLPRVLPGPHSLGSFVLSEQIHLDSSLM